MVSERESTEQLAAQWVAREDRGLSSGESEMLAAWVAKSTSNRLAYLRQKAGWERTQTLGALATEDVSEDRSWYWRFAMGAAATLLLAAAGVALFFYSHAAAPITYATLRNERPVLRLADGTRIQLNFDTRVQTSITRSARTVTLDQGEAYFEVVHDAKRPFVVYAGNRRITDLGTKFSVRREGDDVEIIVTEGKIQVDTLGMPETAPPVTATGGDEVVAKAGQTLVASKSLKDLEADLSWRTGMLTFNQESLANVAEQFNRYNRRQIVVQGRARDIRIGGRFGSDNIDVFASLVHNALGLKVKQEADEVVISK